MKSLWHAGDLAVRTGAVLTVLAATLIMLVLPGTTPAAHASDDDVKWLCHPGIVGNPCEIGMDTTVLKPGGGSSTYTAPRVPSAKRPIDCFYVYPTVSNQLTPNATKDADPEVTSIARFQASRFSTQCRTFAPLYRQFPLAGIPLGLALGPNGPFRVGYEDVVEAWKSYLAKDNHGRGFVLIGHSQGTVVLRKLIREQIDNNPKVRKRLVGAALLGGNVLTAKGATTGGDFNNIPVCTRRGQAGCVVAFSTYATDPIVPFFGSASFDFVSPVAGLRSGPKYQIACTDPSELSGIRGPVGVTIPSKPFAPGPIALGITYSTLGRVPKAPTTWVTGKDRYVGACSTVNGARIYRYNPTVGSMRPLEFPPTWGTHLFDMNLGLERLVSIVHQQRATWLNNR